MGGVARSSRQGERTVAILLYDGVQSLDVTGPAEVFAGAAQALRAQAGDRPETPGYRVRTIAPNGRPVRSTSGLQLVPDGPMPRSAEGIDTLIVPGGEGRIEACREQALLRWLARSPSGCRRVASVCTGSFLLAAAGLLDGRRATTHWAHAGELARRYPLVDVHPDPIFVRDGSIWTSAGVTAGMDLALALVEEDHDRELALLIARHLVLFLRRPGNQSQFSAMLRAQEPEREPLREVQRQVLEDVAGLHTVEAMAERVHMSPRNFARAFRAQTGVTPARYVESVRLEAARRRLEDTTEPVHGIARACGFGSAETMRRSFLRALHVGPSEYRRRFHSSFAATWADRRGHAQPATSETLPIRRRRNR
ncbi:MAG TPA: GlxA family transcriptional regulator [Solirubrobacteraceae bacterium]|jgi:transcriptional regulator GlxA family with amidase domain|nr:GlxA family transcriptional regulator [Solirubrobacteraceae bacterium]